MSEWWHWCALVLSGGLSAVAFKFAVSFDLNGWLERRDKRQLQRAQLECPHVHLQRGEDGELHYRSSAVNPAGTSQWLCQRCGVQLLGGAEQAAALVQECVDRPDLYSRQEDRYRRAVKRLR